MVQEWYYAPGGADPGGADTWQTLPHDIIRVRLTADWVADTDGEGVELTLDNYGVVAEGRSVKLRDPLGRLRRTSGAVFWALATYGGPCPDDTGPYYEPLASASAIVPFELKTDLVAGSTATAYLMLADCSNSNLDAPTFTVYDEPEGGRSGKGRDSITIITGEHGARGHAIYDSSSGHWQILSLGLSSDDIEVSVVTNVDFDIATGAWRKKTRTLTGAFGAESSWTPYESGLAAGSDYQRDAVTVTTTTSGGTTFGTNCTLTATITHATGTGDPTGYVIFRVDGKEQVDNGGPYYTARPVSAGVATATVYLAGGDHVITAEYGGDASYNGGTSEDCSISVAKASTTLALVVVPNSVTYGDEITMTATLTPSVSTSPTIYPSPTGMIVFRRGGVPIQTVTLSSNAAHYTTRTLAAGTGALTAEYRGVIGDLTEAAVGDDNYDTSTSSSTALTIAKKQLTCTAANATKVYGDANPAFSCTWTGLVLSETLSYAVHGSPTISSTATTTSAVGTYPITPVIGTCTADNYLLTGCFVAGTLTVSLAPLVVTANPASMVYGDAIPTFGGTIATLKGTDASTITFQGTCSASSTSPPNTYTISANVVDSGSVLSNYSVTKIDSTLTVAKAPLTVTADWKTMAKDASLPALTGTIDGLKNSDSIAFLGNTTADGHTSGMFKINATVTDSGSKLPRYNVSYVSAYLYVN